MTKITLNLHEKVGDGPEAITATTLCNGELIIFVSFELTPSQHRIILNICGLACTKSKCQLRLRIYK